MLSYSALAPHDDRTDMIKEVRVPVIEPLGLKVGDRLLVSGAVLCGRDAALPKLCQCLDEGAAGHLEFDLGGAALFHTAVSNAGVGPTSSNKLEIEESFEPLCKAGVKMFLGKGAISQETIEILRCYQAVYAVVPPVSALIGQGIASKRCIAFPWLGMEALYELSLTGCPAIVASSAGESLF